MLVAGLIALSLVARGERGVWWGVDIGLVPPAPGDRHDVAGLQLGLAPGVRSMYGIQAGLAWDVALDDSFALQLALFGVTADRGLAGVQTALCLAHCGGSLDGAQVSGVIASARRLRGIQIGVYNAEIDLAAAPMLVVPRPPDPRAELAARLESLGADLSDASRDVASAARPEALPDGRESWGIQIGGVWATASGRFTGIQVAGLDATSGRLRGITVAPFDTSLWVEGLQVGVLARTLALDGVQIGGFNSADSAHGLQIGVVNWARTLRGVQIGLLNVTESRALPLVNVAF